MGPGKLAGARGYLAAVREGLQGVGMASLAAEVGEEEEERRVQVSPAAAALLHPLTRVSSCLRSTCRVSRD